MSLPSPEPKEQQVEEWKPLPIAKSGWHPNADSDCYGHWHRESINSQISNNREARRWVRPVLKIQALWLTVGSGKRKKNFEDEEKERVRHRLRQREYRERLRARLEKQRKDKPTKVNEISPATSTMLPPATLGATTTNTVANRECQLNDGLSWKPPTFQTPADPPWKEEEFSHNVLPPIDSVLAKIQHFRQPVQARPTLNGSENTQLPPMSTLTMALPPVQLNSYQPYYYSGSTTQ